MPQRDRNGPDVRLAQQQANELGRARRVPARDIRHPDGRIPPDARHDADRHAAVRLGRARGPCPAGPLGARQAVRSPRKCGSGPATGRRGSLTGRRLMVDRAAQRVDRRRRWLARLALAAMLMIVAVVIASGVVTTVLVLIVGLAGLALMCAAVWV